MRAALAVATSWWMLPREVREPRAGRLGLPDKAAEEHLAARQDSALREPRPGRLGLPDKPAAEHLPARQERQAQDRSHRLGARG